MGFTSIILTQWKKEPLIKINHIYSTSVNAETQKHLPMPWENNF